MTTRFTEPADPPARADWHARLYAAVALGVGAAIMALEMVASRFLTPVFGGSILTWAALIAVVMVALAAGYLGGGRLADRVPRPGLAGLLIAAAAFYLLGVARWGAAILPVLQVGGDVRVDGLLGAVVLTFVPSALLATYAPFALRLSVRGTGDAGRASGRLYGISTLGSVFGTLFTAFVLVPAIGSTAIAWWLAAFVLLCAVPLFAAALRERRAAPAAVVALFAVLFAIGRGQTPEPEAASLIAAPGPAAEGAPATADGVLAARESPYSSIFVVRDGDYLSLRFARDSRFWDETKIHLADPGELPLAYNRLMLVGLAYPPAPRRLLMLGLGGGSITRFLHAFAPDLALTGVELDAAVIDLARQYFGLEEGPGFAVVCDDGRLFLRRTEQTFDVIMVDTFRGGVVPFHMVSREFFELARTRLAPGGCLVANLHAGSRLFDGVLRTLRTVFDRVDTYQSPERDNVIAVGVAGPPPTPAQLAGRATALQGRHRFPYHLRTLLSYGTQIEPDPEAAVLVDDFAPAEYLAAVERHNRALSPAADERDRPTATAAALRGVRVDGDLGDWPRQWTEHPVVTNGHAYGETDIDGADLLTSPDLSPRFMVAWDPDESLLYVALRVRDDVLVNTGTDPWSSDACEVYAAANPEGMFSGDPRDASAADLGVQQYIAVPGPGSYGGDGANPALGRGDLAATRSRGAHVRRGDVTVYEWAIQVFEHYPDRPLRLTPGQTLGFDVAVVDRDRGGEENAAFITWGPRLPRKYAHPSSLGRLVLAAPE